MIRDELREGLLRWVEPVIALAVVLLGLWWVFATYGILPWVGGALVIGGGAFGFVSARRAMFRTGRDGPGVVQVTEGQIAYFGPLTGGVVALADISRLSLDAGATDPCWRLSRPGQGELEIPLAAEGAENLFDVFAALPGISTGKLLSELRRHRDAPPPQPIVIWERARLRLH